MAGEHDDGKTACRQGARVMMNKRHHAMIAIVAIVVAVALVLNYYLW
jgi:hypothetical protein